MPDDITQLFKDLDEYYPGSRQKRRNPDAAPERKKPEPTDWDAKPYVKKLHGKEVEMFTIGALAKALGKREGTIRAYQDKGYLPKTPYRLPAKEVNGKLRPGRRLFTRSMVEAAIESFAKRNLIHVPRVEWKNHKDLSTEIAVAWKNIQDQLSN